MVMPSTVTDAEPVRAVTIQRKPSENFLLMQCLRALIRKDFPHPPAPEIKKEYKNTKNTKLIDPNPVSGRLGPTKYTAMNNQ